MYNQILIISRARFRQENNHFYFQVNDGSYINTISELFLKTIVVAFEIPKSKVTNETLLLNDIITCISRNNLNIKSISHIFKQIKQSDVVFVFYPLRFSLFISLFGKLIGKKIIAYNGGDWSKMRVLGRKKSLYYTCIVWYYRFLEYLSVKLSNVYIVNNNLLFKKYCLNNKLIKTVPLIRFNDLDIYDKDVSYNNNCIEILAVNHVKPGKKIIELLIYFG